MGGRGCGICELSALLDKDIWKQKEHLTKMSSQRCAADGVTIYTTVLFSHAKMSGHIEYSAQLHSPEANQHYPSFLLSAALSMSTVPIWKDPVGGVDQCGVARCSWSSKRGGEGTWLSTAMQIMWVSSCRELYSHILCCHYESNILGKMATLGGAT